MDSDRDLIGSAQTGTGKTAAFGIPSIHLTNVSDKRVQTLILCPTRELCMQITSDLKKYAKYLNKIGIVPVYGGASLETQVRALKRGAQIVIGTPGRTKDLIKRKKLLLGSVERVVLDEADEMLSMGFKEDLNFILSKTAEQNQTLLFSATMPKKVTSIIKEYMNNPVTIAVDPINTAAANVAHIYHMVQAKDRYEVVKRIADINPKIYGIVFCRTRRETKDVANRLMVDGYNADALHGDLSQSQRDDVMNRFRRAYSFENNLSEGSLGIEFNFVDFNLLLGKEDIVYASPNQIYFISTPTDELYRVPSWGWFLKLSEEQFNESDIYLIKTLNLKLKEL